MSNGHFVWLESKQDALAPQLVSIGQNLGAPDAPGSAQTQGEKYGLSPAEIATWQNGAAMNFYLQVQLISAARDYASALTAARDELQIDKTSADFALPQFNPPAPPAPVAGSVTLQTNFLDWADKIYQRLKLNGLSDAAAKSLGFLVPDTVGAPNPAQMQTRITSIATEPAGHTTISAERKSQPQIHFRVVLDTGQSFDKVLPNSKATFELPTDRVHGFEARAIFADRNGDDFGQWSDARSDSSEV